MLDADQAAPTLPLSTLFHSHSELQRGRDLDLNMDLGPGPISKKATQENFQVLTFYAWSDAGAGSQPRCRPSFAVAVAVGESGESESQSSVWVAPNLMANMATGSCLAESRLQLPSLPFSLSLSSSSAGWFFPSSSCCFSCTASVASWEICF